MSLLGTMPVGVPGRLTPGQARTGFVQVHSRATGRMLLIHASIIGLVEDRGDGLTLVRSRHKGARGWQVSTPLGDILGQLEDVAAAGGGGLP